MPIDCQVFINRSDDFGGVVVGSKRGHETSRGSTNQVTQSLVCSNQLGDVEQSALACMVWFVPVEIPADEIVLEMFLLKHCSWSSVDFAFESVAKCRPIPTLFNAQFNNAARSSPRSRSLSKARHFCAVASIGAFLSTSFLAARLGGRVANAI